MARHSRAEQSLLDAVGETGQLPLPLDELLHSIFSAITHVLRARRCSLMLFDDDRHLVVREAHGLQPDVIASTRLAVGERIAGHVAATRQPLLITDIRPTMPDECRDYTTGSFVSVPVARGGNLYGVLNAADKADGGVFEQHDLTTLILLASHVALCLENVELHRQITRLASADGLTGLYNYRYFQERLDEEVERSRRFGRSLAVMMTDLDRFKEFNDSYGHPAGDRVLQRIAGVLRAGVRRSDVVTRYGGDEFAIIAPETDEEAAEMLAHRLITAVGNYRFSAHGRAVPVQLALSIGIAVHPNSANGKRQLIEQADRAMYAAKQTKSGYRLFEGARAAAR